MPSRCLASFLLAASLLLSQNPTIRTTVPIVVLPTSVTDRHGQPVSGLKADDFELIDNGQRKPVKIDIVDSQLPPIALVVLVQTTANALSALAKICKEGALLSQGVVGENGEVAVISFDDEVRVRANFTNNVNTVSDVFRSLKPNDATHARLLDALERGLTLLEARQSAGRSSLLLIGESRDRGSQVHLADLQQRLQRAQATVYSMHYSVYLTPFTIRPEEYEPTGGGYIDGIRDLVRLSRENTMDSLTKLTGGMNLRFQTRSKLEKDLMRLSADIHNRYAVSFIPDREASPSLHALSLRVKGRPELSVLTRAGYWSLPSDSNAK